MDRRKMTPLARKLADLTRAMQSILKCLEALTEALYEIERLEAAAQAQIIGHGLVCPLVTEPSVPPHEALGCPGCKFCDDESLYRSACCTHILGPVVNGTGRCDRRKEAKMLPEQGPSEESHGL